MLEEGRRRAEHLEEAKRRLEAEECRELGGTDAWVQKELQGIANRKVKAAGQAQERMAAVEQRGARETTVAQRSVELRAALRGAISKESCEALRQVLQPKQLDTLIQLMLGIDDARKVAHAVVTASGLSSPKQCSAMLRACERGLKAFNSSEVNTAQKVFAASDSNMPPAASAIFKLLCELELGLKPDFEALAAIRALQGMHKKC